MLRSYSDLFYCLALNYEGSPYTAFPSNCMAQIIFRSNDTDMMKIPMAPEFEEFVKVGDNVTILDPKYTFDPVTGNAFVGGNYKTKYSTPENQIPFGREAHITEGYLYLIDKDGNRILYAIYDPDAKNPYVASGKRKIHSFGEL